MKVTDVIDVKIKSRHYIDTKTGLQCFGHFVIVTFICYNKVMTACSAVQGTIADSPQNRVYEREAFLRRMKDVIL